MKILFTIGDWSDDGHGKTENYMVESSHPLADVEAAYRAGVEKTKLDPVNNLCADYEDNRLDEDTFERLVKLGYDFNGNAPQMQEDIDNFEDIYLERDEFLSIVFFIIQQGNSDIKLEVATDGKQPEFHAGGYGLFN